MNLVKCKIADFDVSFESDIKHLQKIMHAYLFDFDIPQFDLSLTDEDIVYEKENADEASNITYLTSYKLAAFFRKLGERIPLSNAFVLHSVCFDVDGEGVVFAARSGTGKSTHTFLWQKFLGDKMTIVNGDKPIVRFFDDEPNVPYAYGTPWNGKEGLGCNMRTPVKHICFIERNETNYVEKMDATEAIDRIFNQVYMPKDPAAMTNTVQLINRFINCCSIWKIHCNMDEEAGKIAYNTIFKNNL